MTSKNSSSTLVSVVIPVYNGEKYLSAAIFSILNQTHLNWELLVVDDGSNDSTSVICDKLALKDSRIKVFHQLNRGVNAARAKGIDNASGEYLTFLDADDMLTSNALEYMLNNFEEGLDLLVCGKRERLLNNEDYIELLWKGEAGLTLWGKMFKTSLFRQIDYALDSRIVMGEDLLLNSMYALKANRIRMVQGKVYLVNHNNEASVTKTFKHNWEYEKLFFSKVKEFFLSKCTALSNFKRIQLLVNKCWLNAMKYVMLDGGKINYNDEDFKIVEAFVIHNRKEFGPSEKLVFIIRNHKLYSSIMRFYLRKRSQIKKMIKA